jgi:mono/diheme cytochrome c family protein
VKSLAKEKSCLLVGLVALAGGCDLPGKPLEADRPVRADQVKDFDTLYSTRCAGCHGANGKLGPAPPLNDPLFLAIVPDAVLLHVIAEGRAVTAAQKTPMPAFARAHGGPLTDAQVKVLAEGMKKRWPSAASEGAPPPYLSPVGNEGGDKGAGARVFARACAGCHGKQGEGVERDGVLRRRIHDPAFLALLSDKALRRIIITGRPDLGMPAYDGRADRPADFRPLTSAQIDDLVALLQSWRSNK